MSDNHADQESTAEGQRDTEPREISVPDPNGPGRLRARFVGFGDPVTITDPRVVGGTRNVDRVWIEYLEGPLAGERVRVNRASVRGLDD